MAFPMTEEERYKLALMRGQVSPNPNAGMAASGFTAPISEGVPDYVAQDPKGSIKGRQGIADKQREYAQSLRGRAAPKGMTAGPLNVYYGPNWADSLAHAGGEVMGGYLEGRANRADKAIDVDRQRALERAVAKEDAEKQAEIDYRAGRDVVGDVRGDANLAVNQGNLARNIANDIVDAAGETRDRDYISVVRPDGTGMSTIRQGDDLPEGTILAESFFDSITAKGKGGAKSATQRVAEFRANSLRTARKSMQKLIDGGYNPSGWEGFKDKVANSTDLTRWAASKEGKQFQSSASTAKEALLRTATGAAAPEGENREYTKTLIPSIGDDRETLLWKMKKLTRLQAIMDESSGIETDGEAEVAWLQAVSQLRAEEAEEAENEAELVEITTKEAFDELESGALYLEDGKQYRKP